MQEDYTKNDRHVSSAFSNFYDILESLIFAIVAVVVVFLFFGRLSRVQGSSMNDTLTHNDNLIVVDPLFLYQPKVGDIIVVDGGEAFTPYTDPIVKRIIATEGQSIIINFKEETVYVDGILLEEPYAKYLYPDPNTDTYKYHEFLKYKKLLLSEASYDSQNGILSASVPENHVFVMGDNRLDSADSRFDAIGFVHEDYIVGKAVFRLFPFSKIGGL